MNFKDIIVPFAVALIIAAGLQYYFGSKDDQGSKKSAQVYEITQQADPDVVEFKADDYELDFSTTKPKDYQDTKTVVNTDYGTYHFTTDGGSVEQVIFKRNENKVVREFDTFSSYGKNDKLFLLALSEKSPYYYRLVNHQKLDDKDIISYEAPFADGSIKKEFTVYKSINKVDLNISLSLNKEDDKGVRARLLFQSPHLKGIKELDTVRAFFDEQGSMRVYSNLKELTNKLLGGPISLLGLDDRYFAFSLIKDQQELFQRAYFKKLSEQSLRAYLQTPWIKKSGSWNVSFYMGPKQAQVFAAVDPRLDDILDYGWLAPLSKLLLKILKWIYEYIQNFGWAIILLTVLIKLLMLPFTWKGEQQIKGMAGQRDEMNRKLAYLKEKYKNDPQGLARERAEVMRKHGMPSMGGCLPLLAQFPIFIALNRVLSSSIDLYQAPFLWIPNLAAPDPYYILPIIVAVGIVLHRPSSSPDPKQGLMPYAIALVFGAITLQLSAGLVLFILTNTVTGVIQTQVTKFFKR